MFSLEFLGHFHLSPMSNTKEDYHYYEGMFITRAGGGKQAWELSEEAVEEILNKYDAEIDYVERWADQNLEYAIQKEKRGKYLLTYFRVDPSDIDSIRRDAKLEERILRTLIVNREKEEIYEDMIDARIEKNKEEEEEEEEESESETEETSEEEDVEASEEEQESDEEKQEEVEETSETDEEETTEEAEEGSEETEEEQQQEEEDKEEEEEEVIESR